MIRQIKATEYQCDGCGRVTIEAADEPVNGITVNWTEINGGGWGGRLWVDREQCLPKALKRRNEIEAEREQEARDNG